MRAWINGDLLADATAPAVSVDRPRADRRGRGLRGDQGRRRAAVRARPAPRAAAPVGCGRWVWRASTRTPYAGGSRPCSDGADLPLGRIRITVTGGPAPMGSGRGDAAPTVVVVADAMQAVARDDRGGDGAVAAQRARRAGRPQDHVVRRERRRARRRRSEQGASEAIFANLAGHLCEGTGSNVFYVVDGELRTPTLASGCLAGVTRALILEWYGGREVDEPIEVVERASEVFLASTTRDVQAVATLGRPRAAGARAGHPEAAATCGASASRSSRTLSRVSVDSTSRSRSIDSVPSGTSGEGAGQERAEVARRQLGDQAAVRGAELEHHRGPAVLVDARRAAGRRPRRPGRSCPGAAGRGRSASAPSRGGLPKVTSTAHGSAGS